MARYSPFAPEGGSPTAPQNAYGGTTQFSPVQFPDFNSDSFSASANDDSSQSQNSWAAPTFGTPLQPTPQHYNTTSMQGNQGGAASSSPYPAGPDGGGSWPGGYNAQSGVHYLAEGGAIPDADEDDGLASNAGVADPTTDGINAALQVVKEAMIFGRKKHGLPADEPEQQDATDGAIPNDEGSEESYAAGGAIADDIEAGRGPADDEQYGRPQVVDDPDAVRPPISGDNLDRTQEPYDNVGAIPSHGDNSGAAPVMDMSGDNSGAAPVAEAGAIPEDTSGVGMSGPMGGGSTPLQYLQGADAMPETQAKALEASVASEAAHDPNTRTLLASAKAGEMDGPAAAFAYMQRNRKIYDAAMSHARAAITGVDGRPPSLDAAAASATKAYVHMPEASNVRFVTDGRGIIASVSSLADPGKRQQFSLTPQQFAQAVDITKDGQFDRVMEEGGMGAVLQRIAGSNAPVANAAPAQRAHPVPDAPTPGETGLSFPEYDRWKAAHPGKSTDKINPALLPAKDTDSNALKAQRAYPMASQEQNRSLYSDKLTGADADRKAKVDAAETKGEYQVKATETRGKTAVDVQGMKGDVARDVEGSRSKGRQARTDAQLKIAAEKLLQSYRAEQGRNGRAALSASEKTLVGMAAAGQKLTPEQKRRADDLIMSKEQTGAPSAPQPNATRPPVPNAPAPQMSQQDQQALLWANANPNDPRAAKIKQLHGVQ